ncbi:MAG: hypothetical protein F4213_00265 [Boseongicola sp. SB0677_bin_26]|nr:hypothetical protein [Boseongicola sp. SB0677_bin_26]
MTVLQVETLERAVALLEIRQLPDTDTLHSFLRSPESQYTRHPDAASRMNPSMVSATVEGVQSTYFAFVESVL